VDISADQVRVALFSLIAFVVAVSVHEFGHALVADRLGDRIPRLQGRLTLSPLAHIDPIGTIAVPLLGALLPGGLPLIAWGKPVQTNPANYTRRFSTKTGHMLVAAAGPFMNLVLAVIASVVIVVLAKAGIISGTVQVALIRYLVLLNIMLLFFNLIPIGPLDGAAVLEGLLPASARGLVEANRKYGMLILLVLAFTGLIRALMTPADWVAGVWIGVLSRLVTA
jgi:Zn-dependent protease